ncbi:class I SAM-dependent methyltransferase [uncultured Sunxiuqinia sp.]|jgi:predicted O-methyltransferase YrrM|uniref:O-methyltransferase n=1 Tax=uncultured Sunxiuqinia sp. TaxID=1573825 RepID=UPI0030DC7B4D
MKSSRSVLCLFSISLVMLFVSGTLPACAQENGNQEKLDQRVKSFLESSKNNWRDMNVPESDGQLLYDIIIENNYTRAVEIGTSTGHSGIWIAWALSKTGGKLITIEINKRRYLEALANFKKAGVLDFVDVRLADAHELVPALEGPFDFVFSDADKSWYINYFKDLDPKLEVGACFVTHNVSQHNNYNFYEYVSQLGNYKTTLDDRGAGMAISYKKAE